MDIEKWKEINTFYCEKLKIYLSPEQCKANRERPDASGWEAKFIIRRPPACKTCTDWQHLCEKVYKQRQEHTMADKTIKCLECGKETENFGRGLCRACYLRLRKEGRLPPKETRKKQEAIMQQDSFDEKKYRITVDFGRIPEVFDFISKKASQEFRTVEMQVLWELKQLATAEDIKIGGTA